MFQPIFFNIKLKLVHILSKKFLLSIEKFCVDDNVRQLLKYIHLYFILTEIDLLLVHFERLSDHIFDAFHMLCIWKTLHLNFLNFLFDFL